MNCKINHWDDSITFLFDVKKSEQRVTQTQIRFDKRSKLFSTSEQGDYYGQGCTASLKEINYTIKYLTKGGFL